MGKGVYNSAKNSRHLSVKYQPWTCLGIVFAAVATVAEKPYSCMRVSATVRTDRGRGLAQGWAPPLLLEQG